MIGDAALVFTAARGWHLVEPPALRYTGKARCRRRGCAWSYAGLTPAIQAELHEAATGHLVRIVRVERLTA